MKSCRVKKPRLAPLDVRVLGMTGATPVPWARLCGNGTRLRGPGGFRADRYCFRILKLGGFGDGDASVHRWRRSDATGAATAQPGGLRRWGEPGSGDRGLHRRTGRTLDKVRTEMSLHVLAYNLKRMIRIFGVGPL